MRSPLLLMAALLAGAGLAAGCPCPAATVLTRLPADVPADACCLNYSGSALGHVRWSLFTNGTRIQTLDLSACNITSVDAAEFTAGALQKVYLHHNQLTALPRDFLAGRPNLTDLDLSGNRILELPEGFLRDSDNLQNLNLQGNRLRLLPGAVLLKPRLQRLDLGGNPWDCSCSLLERLQGGRSANGTAGLVDLLGNLTCASPGHLAGRPAWSVRLGDACRPAGLTALFIALPLAILSALVLCWCCGRKRRSKKETPASGKKRASGSSNGEKHGRKQQQQQQHSGAGELSRAGAEALKAQLFLRPASTLLGSTRDIYEEVEIKLGSVESIPHASSGCSGSTDGRQEGAGGPGGAGGASRAELETVSVTEVMKDSADREKAYLTQSTEYYSLVPGLELDDSASDHGEYEDVSLS